LGGENSKESLIQSRNGGGILGSFSTGKNSTFLVSDEVRRDPDRTLHSKRIVFLANLLRALYLPTTLSTLTERPVSSKISLVIASSGDSFISSPPPGNTQTGTSLLKTRRTLLASGPKTIPITLLTSICKFILVISIFCLCSCSSDSRIWVQTQRLDESYLASSFVGSPNPLQKGFRGTQIVISWAIPREKFAPDLSLILEARFDDLSCKSFKFCLGQSRGSLTNDFLDTPNVLSYKVQIVSPLGGVIASWSHPLWVDPFVLQNESTF
jgi:hypothetical protein